MPEPSEAGTRSTEEHLLPLLLEQVRRFLKAEVRPAEIDRRAEIPASLLASARRLGLFALSVPEELGGLGECARVIAEIARVDRSVATTVGLHNGLGVRPLAELGSVAQKRALLPRLASGELIAAFAATEAGAGSDLQSVRTTAVPTEEGRLRLDGQKSYVTNGGFAGLFTVLARTPELGGPRSQALVLVPREAEGVTIGAEESKLGIRGSSTVTLYLRGVEVPRENLLGAPGRGAEHAHSALCWGRSLMAAGCLGTAEAALRMAAEHAGARRQFRRPLIRFGATRMHLAEMANTTFAMNALVRRAGEVEARGGSLELASTAAKVFCSEGAFDVCDRAIQLHGALGFLEEAGVARLARDCRVTRIFEGANDVLLVRLGAALLSGALVEEEPPPREGLSPALLERHRDRASVQGELEAIIAATRERLGVSAMRQQALLQRIARAKIALLAAEASIAEGAPGAGELLTLRASHAARRFTVEAAAHARAVASTPAKAAGDAALIEALYPTPEPGPREPRARAPRSTAP